ncbi:uncharacterized protein L3040_007200 [Drepanopeziza brunnea f. sp. 'multigermtubi']|uniref:uncharacterized protein n=1 Tax=Drepanopeziza brunnea f. sp. 'multigermtubi' TaxID=698441 RepID=UPI00238B19F1|nr:hypothetical protein L3040_007200 [Drepanopeziza brunnea f. sp. 'multigermtubi']
MVDDNMEISSEHGHNMEQADIDIDIDLTPGNMDEDYILEDATSQIELGTEFLAQPSPAAHDDVMRDDDNESYHMEDAELLDAGEEHTMEQGSMSDTIDGDATYFGADNQEAEQQRSEQVEQATGIPYHEDIVPSDDNLGLSFEEEAPQDVLEHEDTQYHDQNPPQDSNDHPEFTAAKGSPTLTPNLQDPTPTAPAEPRSPPASGQDPLLSSPEVANDHKEPIPCSKSPRADHIRFDEAIKNGDGSEGLDLRVIYRETEYNMFQTSDLDHPDSYFIADVAYLRRPLSELFKAIREIICEDLTDEDELCIAVESLGLETEESSYLAEEFYLENIMSLYAALLRNAGVEPSGEICYMQLKTRKSFSGRFAALTAGVMEGKGLTDFASLDDQAIARDGTQDIGESNHELESTPEVHPSGEPAKDYRAQQEPEFAESRTSDQHATGHEPEEYNFEDLQTNYDNNQESAVTTATSNNVVAGCESVKPQLPKIATGTDVDEDGDLIDYSDDEAEESATPKSVTNKTLANEHQKVDENLRQRSLSRPATGDKLSEDPAGPVPCGANETEEGARLSENGVEYDQFNEECEQQETSEEYGLDGDQVNEREKESYPDEIGYDQSNGEGYEYDDENAEHELTAVDGAAHNDEGHEHELAAEEGRGPEASGGDDSGHDDAPEQGANDESAIGNFDDVELDFEDRESSIQDDHNHLEYKLEHHEASEIKDCQDKSNKDGLDIVETTDSSVTMGAETEQIQYEDELLDEDFDEPDRHEKAIIVKEGLATREAIEYTDEIGYEDDDEEEVKKSQGSTTAEDTPPNSNESPNANGKRPLADFESSDIQNPQTKDFKRPRP